MDKTTLSIDTIRAFLQKEFADTITNLEQLIEGMESQAFSFIHADKAYVMRVNRSAEGFSKDAYAYRHFSSEALPIPKVVQIGQIDARHAFGVTERMPGVTLQDTDGATVERVLEPTVQVWRAIGEADVAGTPGYGDFHSNGKGLFPSWRAYLLSILDPSYYDWDAVGNSSDRALVATLCERLQALVRACPEERRPVHGDFGANNVLTDGRRITAVLDWENAKYGDPLFDIAGAYFWSTWLGCMQAFADYCEQHLGQLPNYRERIWCYQLRCGLDEIYCAAIERATEMTAWAQAHSKEMLNMMRHS